MPSLTPTACPRTGCSHRQPCPVHHKARAKAYDRNRQGDYARAVYRSTRWRRLRLMVLADDPLCALCQVAEAVDVDHVQAIDDAPELAYARDNLRGLCRECHNRVTHGDKSRQARGRG